MAGDLKLGLNTGYWAGGPPPGVTDAIAEAERLGFDSIWAAEAYGSDCLTPLAWWGAATQRVKLGSAIVQMSGRQPAAAPVWVGARRGSGSRRAGGSCSGGRASRRRPRWRR